MKTTQSIKVHYGKKDYNLPVDVLLEVFTRLLGKNIEYESDDEIYRYLKKLKLYDEVFLEYIESVH